MKRIIHFNSYSDLLAIIFFSWWQPLWKTLNQYWDDFHFRGTKSRFLFFFLFVPFWSFEMRANNIRFSVSPLFTIDCGCITGPKKIHLINFWHIFSMKRYELKMIAWNPSFYEKNNRQTTKLNKLNVWHCFQLRRWLI